jgi:hypothetical protein
MLGEILDSWLSIGYQPNLEDDACLAQIEILESEYAAP